MTYNDSIFYFDTPENKIYVYLDYQNDTKMYRVLTSSDNEEYVETNFTIDDTDYADESEMAIAIAKMVVLNITDATFDVTVYLDSDLETKLFCFKLDKDYNRLSNSVETLTLSLCARNGRIAEQYRVCELSLLGDETRQQVMDAFENEDSEVLSDILFDNQDDYFELYNLWGDEDEETLQYELDDEEGELTVYEYSVYDYKPEDNYDIEDGALWLVHTEGIKRSTATFKVPANIDMTQVKFHANHAMEGWVDGADGVLGDTITDISAIRYNGVDYYAEDVCDAGTYGDGNFYLLKWNAAHKYWEALYEMVG